MKIRPTPKFVRDFKKLKKKHYNVKKLQEVIEHIVNKDIDVLVRVYRDHALKGNWKGFRKCHIESDWLLIYCIRKDKNLVELVLTRTGSHDELF